MLWVVGLCLFILVVLLFSRMNVIIYYSYNQDERSDLIHVIIRVYRIQVYQKDFNLLEFFKPVYKQSGYKRDTLLQRIKFLSQSIKATFNYCSAQYKVMTPFLRKINISSFTWKTDCGTGDAVTSGSMCGAIWTAKGLLMRYLRVNSGDLRRIHLQVNPHFQQEVMTTEMRCIVSITIGKAILALWHVRNSQKQER